MLYYPKYNNKNFFKIVFVLLLKFKLIFITYYKEVCIFAKASLVCSGEQVRLSKFGCSGNQVKKKHC